MPLARCLPREDIIDEVSNRRCEPDHETAVSATGSDTNPSDCIMLRVSKKWRRVERVLGDCTRGWARRNGRGESHLPNLSGIRESVALEPLLFGTTKTNGFSGLPGLSYLLTD